jgi:hypothetical protein
MITIRRSKDRIPMCPGCGLYPHVNNWEHRTDCTAEQIPEHEALANIAAVFGPHLTPHSVDELQQLINAPKGNTSRRDR